MVKLARLLGVSVCTMQRRLCTVSLSSLPLTDSLSLATTFPSTFGGETAVASVPRQRDNFSPTVFSPDLGSFVERLYFLTRALYPVLSGHELASALARYTAACYAPGVTTTLHEKKAAAKGAASSAAVQTTSTAHELEGLELTREVKSWGFVDVLFERPAVSFVHLALSPRQSIPLHWHPTLQESELILSSGLLCSGKPVPPGAAFAWNRVSHSYENPTDSMQTILCVDQPKFEQNFEIELPTATFSAEDETAQRVEFHNDFWMQCMRNRTKFVFPGGLPEQTVELVCGTELPSGTMADAVLVFARGTQDAANGVGELTRDSLLMVKHRKRGWELPGGKIDPGETPEQAARRETQEEGACRLKNLEVVAHYTIRTSRRASSSSAASTAKSLDCVEILPERSHTKVIFVAEIDEVEPVERMRGTDTKERRIFDRPPSAEEVCYGADAEQFSPLLKDNVYSVGVKLFEYASQTSPRNVRCI